MVQPGDSPLHFVMHEIAGAFNAGLFYAAVNLSLSIPDICSSDEELEINNRFKVEKRYVPWCTKWLCSKMLHLTAEDIWALRGGIIHQGQTFGHPKARYERIVFILPDGRGNKFQIASSMRSDAKPVTSISLDYFCKVFLTTAEEWIEATKDNKDIQEKLEGLIRFRPNGYENHLIGTAVIA